MAILYLQSSQLVFKKTEHMKNVLRLTYILESLWNEAALHTTNTQLSTSRRKSTIS